MRNLPGPGLGVSLFQPDTDADCNRCTSSRPLPRRLLPHPVPTPTATPSPTEPAPGPASGSGAILPLNLEDPQVFLSELSAAEQSCLPENLDLQLLMAPEVGPDLVSPEEASEFLQCLEHETLLRLFLTGLIGPGRPAERGDIGVRSQWI